MLNSTEQKEASFTSEMALETTREHEGAHASAGSGVERTGDPAVKRSAFWSEKELGRALLIWIALCSVLGFGFVFWVLGVCPSLHTSQAVGEAENRSIRDSRTESPLAGKISEGRAVPGGGIEDGSLQNGLLNFLDNYNRSSGISTTTRYY